MDRIIAEYIEIETMLEIKECKKCHAIFNQVVKSKGWKKVNWWVDNGEKPIKRIGYLDTKSKSIYQANIFARTEKEVCQEVVQNPRFKSYLKYELL